MIDDFVREPLPRSPRTMVTTKFFNVCKMVGIGAQLVRGDEVVLNDGNYQVHIRIDYEGMANVFVFDCTDGVGTYGHKAIHVAQTPGQWNIITGWLFDVDTSWGLNG